MVRSNIFATTSTVEGIMVDGGFCSRAKSCWQPAQVSVVGVKSPTPTTKAYVGCQLDFARDQNPPSTIYALDCTENVHLNTKLPHCHRAQNYTSTSALRPKLHCHIGAELNIILLQGGFLITHSSRCGLGGRVGRHCAFFEIDLSLVRILCGIASGLGGGNPCSSA